MLHEVRYAWRVLRRAPGVTAVAVIALALGIGANTAIFSVVNTVLLRPLAYEDLDRLVQLFQTEPELPRAPLTGADFLDWREQNHVFERAAGYTWANLNLTGLDQPQRVTAGAVTADLFPVLGVSPAMGRDFAAGEDRKGQDQVTILSHAFWELRLGSDPNVLGRKLNMDGRAYTVIGVMSRGFRAIPEGVDLWVPLVLSRENNPRGEHFMQGIARLKHGVTLSRAQAELDAISRRLTEQYPNTNTEIGARLVPLFEQRVGKVRPILLALLGAVAFVLLIACANVANLMLARAAARVREVAVRTALGAGRWRLLRQSLTESVMLSVLGGAAGLILALWGIHLLRAATGADLPRVDELRVDGTVLAFTLAVSLLTGLLFGLAPAWQQSRMVLNEVLKEGGRSMAGRAHGGLRSVLVVGEMALSLVLLIGSGLMIKSFVRLLALDLGYDSSKVLTMELSLPENRYQSPEERATFFRNLLERMRSTGGVMAAAATSKLPLEGGTNGTVRIEGRPAPAHEFEGPLVEFTRATPGYFQAMGIPLLKGRSFEERDESGAVIATVINETMARKFWPSEDALGKIILRGNHDRYQVVGIARDVRQHGIEREPLPEMFYPYGRRDAPPNMSLVVRAVGNPGALAGAMRAQVVATDKDQPVYSVRTMEQVFAENAAARRFQMTLFGVFAGVALALAAVGIYGVMSYSVSQRGHEIGIRMALGARTADVLRMVVQQGLALVLVGVAVGIAGALALTRLLRSLLFGVSTTDAPTFAAVSLFLVMVALAASYIPAHRATRVDPVAALRHE